MTLTAIELTIRPAKRAGIYQAHLGGHLVCATRQPFYDSARVLLRAGYHPWLLLSMRHEGSSRRSLTSTIGAAATLTVRESAFGIRTVPYRPWDGELKA